MDNQNRRRSIKPVEFEAQEGKENKKTAEKSAESRRSRQIHVPVATQEAENKKEKTVRSTAQPLTRKVTTAKRQEQTPRSHETTGRQASVRSRSAAGARSAAIRRESTKAKENARPRETTRMRTVPQQEEVVGNAAWKSIGKKILRTAIMLICSLAIVALLGVLVYKYAYGHYIAPVDADSTEQINVYISQDDSLKMISQKLEEAGIIRSSTIFKYYVDFSDMSTKLLAGKFTLSPSMTYDDIINVLKRPAAAQATTSVFLVEGILIKEMVTKLEEADVLTGAAGSSFAAKAASGQDYASQYWFIQEAIERDAAQESHRDYILEGYLFPDTYNFYVASDIDEAMKKMLDNFNGKYTEEYKQRARELGMTTDEVITLASIIEKEAGKVEDFAKVSAVFYNRLDQDMMLQSCATLQYFMPEKKFVYSAEETKTPSPYNTYIHKGLPVGPICNPGKAAIEAALWPDEQFMEEGYLYFCAGDPAEGTTIFAKTYEEHQANVAKYQSLW